MMNTCEGNNGFQTTQMFVPRYSILKMHFSAPQGCKTLNPNKIATSDELASAHIQFKYHFHLKEVVLFICHRIIFCAYFVLIQQEG